MSKPNDQTIEKIIRLMQHDESFDAPADAIQWSKNIFRGRTAEPKKSAIEKVLAVLQIDLSPNRAAFGERSASAAQARQMFFRAGENALDIRVRQTKKGFDLHGQILGEGFAGCAVKLGEFETTANELGEFKLSEVSGGKYDLHLQKDAKEIAVENLELK
ncbi:MAG: hypothetical protein ACR2HG_07480 [Pyrinomonadaceae bacterium]